MYLVKCLCVTEVEIIFYCHSFSRLCSCTRCYQRVPVLDGNVIRVLTRLRQIGSSVQSSSTTTLLWDLATKLVDVERPGDFNQAMMELGAICCTPKQPDCSHCPLGMAGLCGAFESVRTGYSWITILSITGNSR
ncbi:uncharacterized protein DEA37_0001431 [Paragonimus westermani]|uniref:Adenine DNA glycosylase n=1 Tax=Paragonimus westermani TaxID=34504 RepID=A0A5J4N4T4_9TREM|nr:uncharacterized protein DEA37_0001431 [Paragonimus westermani]